ncbi:hypothetical protein K402DRAFT_98462 [Aulographum hederae CBS 113979]|uniref:Uncharacterized protein n=1 Tax=Aulographum hederae CBS 113979 TaxID=1176131 RepID=A0A6G1GZ28_9PEZI|nr:hypothetical protein K402DRAFT_98462 [Aulographum hederae CBS 113979]
MADIEPNVTAPPSPPKLSFNGLPIITPRTQRPLHDLLGVPIAIGTGIKGYWLCLWEARGLNDSDLEDRLPPADIVAENLKSVINKLKQQAQRWRTNDGGFGVQTFPRGEMPDYWSDVVSSCSNTQIVLISSSHALLFSIDGELTQVSEYSL